MRQKTRILAGMCVGCGARTIERGTRTVSAKNIQENVS